VPGALRGADESVVVEVGPTAVVVVVSEGGVVVSVLVVVVVSVLVGVVVSVLVVVDVVVVVGALVVGPVVVGEASARAAAAAAPLPKRTTVASVATTCFGTTIPDYRRITPALRSLACGPSPRRLRSRRRAPEAAREGRGA
jgi:hypothetical protein